MIAAHASSCVIVADASSARAMVLAFGGANLLRVSSMVMSCPPLARRQHSRVRPVVGDPAWRFRVCPGVGVGAVRQGGPRDAFDLAGERLGRDATRRPACACGLPPIAGCTD